MSDTQNHSFVLGSRLRDRVTGFTGIATARVQYLNGCIQYALKPSVAKDKTEYPDGIYIDEGQLAFVDDGVNGTEDQVKPKRTGGPQNDVPPV